VPLLLSQQGSKGNMRKSRRFLIAGHHFSSSISDPIRPLASSHTHATQLGTKIEVSPFTISLLVQARLCLHLYHRLYFCLCAGDLEISPCL